MPCRLISEDPLDPLGYVIDKIGVADAGQVYKHLS